MARSVNGIADSDHLVKSKFNLNSFDEVMHRATIRAAAITPINDATLDACFASNVENSVLSVWDIAVL